MTCFDVCKTNRPAVTSDKPVILLSTQMSIVCKYLLLFQISLVPLVDCDENIYTYETISIKHEVFILGGPENWSEEQERMVERLGEMRKGRRERIEKGSRERTRKEKETKRLFEEEGLREPPFIEFSRSDPAM